MGLPRKSGDTVDGSFEIRELNSPVEVKVVEIYHSFSRFLYIQTVVIAGFLNHQQ